jgi:hypothetical protein
MTCAGDFCTLDAMPWDVVDPGGANCGAPEVPGACRVSGKNHGVSPESQFRFDLTGRIACSFPFLLPVEWRTLADAANEPLTFIFRIKLHHLLTLSLRFVINNRYHIHSHCYSHNAVKLTDPI